MTINNVQGIHLGAGLIGIGRRWGYKETPVPQEQEVLQFLSYALQLGIVYFDTAASYGTSEERLGKFLAGLAPAQRENLLIATKFGDHWDSLKQEAYVDHSYQALKNSLDRSMALLKQIDLLYLHKAHLQALQSPDVARAFVYAKTLGIPCFGASVSDMEAAHFALNSELYSVIQLPYNLANQTFAEIIDEATRKGKKVVINRPFNMGAMLYAESASHSASDKVHALQFILQKSCNGFVLTGTKSISHLQENYDSFAQAKNAL